MSRSRTIPAIASIHHHAEEHCSQAGQQDPDTAHGFLLLFWNRNATRYGVKASDEEREQALTRILASAAWIIHSTSTKETLADLWGLLTWNHGNDTDNLRRARLFIAHLSDKVCECKSMSDVFNVLNR